MNTGADIDAMADLCDDLAALIARIDLQPLSKATTARVALAGPVLRGVRDGLRQAADETCNHWQAITEHNRALRRLASDLSRMDPDKRREHAIDDQLDALHDALADEWDADDRAAEGWVS